MIFLLVEVLLTEQCEESQHVRFVGESYEMVKKNPMITYYDVYLHDKCEDLRVCEIPTSHRAHPSISVETIPK